jgi:hypothetical protein
MSFMGDQASFMRLQDRASSRNTLAAPQAASALHNIKGAGSNFEVASSKRTSPLLVPKGISSKSGMSYSNAVDGRTRTVSVTTSPVSVHSPNLVTSAKAASSKPSYSVNAGIAAHATDVASAMPRESLGMSFIANSAGASNHGASSSRCFTTVNNMSTRPAAAVDHKSDIAACSVAPEISATAGRLFACVERHWNCEINTIRVRLFSNRIQYRPRVFLFGVNVCMCVKHQQKRPKRGTLT